MNLVATDAGEIIEIQGTGENPTNQSFVPSNKAEATVGLVMFRHWYKR